MKKEMRIIRHNDAMESLKEAYNIMLEKKAVKYTGPLLTSSNILGVSFNIDEMLKTYKYQMKEQGRTPLDIILSCAFQLGIQQGVYLCSEKPSYLEIADEDKTRFKHELSTLLMTPKEREGFMEKIQGIIDNSKK